MNYMYENEECSSGCESGWTLYLQHSSSISPTACYHERHRDTKRSDDDDDESEDLSMVSDASSGPSRQLHEEEGYGYNDKNGFYHCAIDEQPLLSTRKMKKNKKKKSRERCVEKVQEQHSSLLDDTASSPFLDLCSKTRSQASVENVVEYSQGYSTTQFQVRPPYEEQHHDFFQSGNQLQQQNQWFEGKRW